VVADNVLSNLSTALWASDVKIQRSSIATLTVLVKNHTGRPLLIPKDLFGCFGLQAKLDGVEQPPFAFDYWCGEHPHEWVMKSGDILSRQIPVFTGNASERLRDLDTLHPLPMPVETVLVGVYAEQARDIRVRLRLMASTNQLAATGGSEIRFTVTP